MLEHPSLLLRTQISTGKGWTRSIVEPDSGRFLGQATCGDKTKGWFAWLRGETIRVFETEDASLLMTLFRPWAFSRTWEVRDADDRRVGLVYRNELWNARGERLFVVQESSANPSLCFLDPTRREAATLQLRDAGEMLLTFHEVSEGDPFARMTILGKALLWRPLAA